MLNFANTVRSIAFCVLLVSLFNIAGCVRETEIPPPNSVLLFCDRSDARQTRMVIIRADGMWLQVSDFPDGNNRRFYKAPAAVAPNRWLTHRGELKPPFTPSGPHFARFTISADGNTLLNESYFRDDNTELKSYLQSLESTCQQQPMSETPEWIRQNALLRRYCNIE